MLKNILERVIYWLYRQFSNFISYIFTPPNTCILKKISFASIKCQSPWNNLKMVCYADVIEYLWKLAIIILSPPLFCQESAYIWSVDGYSSKVQARIDSCYWEGINLMPSKLRANLWSFNVKRNFCSILWVKVERLIWKDIIFQIAWTCGIGSWNQLKVNRSEVPKASSLA